MKLHVPNEHIVCLEENSDEARLFAYIFGNKRLGLFGYKWPFRDIHHDSWVRGVIVYALPVVGLERANTQSLRFDVINRHFSSRKNYTRRALQAALSKTLD